VAFVATDLPEANEHTVGMMIVLAQAERRATANRIKEALAAAKAQGRKLGGRRNGPIVDYRLGHAAKTAKADAFAARLAPILTGMRQEGLSLHRMAAELPRQGILTAAGGAWTASAVKRVMTRAAGL